jgi:glycogenin glucosyltransferase
VPQYQPGKPYVPPSATVQKHVFGESTDVYHGYAPEERIAPPPVYEIAPTMVSHHESTGPPPQTPTITVEEPFTEPIPEAEAIDQGIVEPVPTTEQRRFSAPQMEWDATR